jgi:hypothetical protein
MVAVNASEIESATVNATEIESAIETKTAINIETETESETVSATAGDVKKTMSTLALLVYGVRSGSRIDRQSRPTPCATPACAQRTLTQSDARIF